MAVGRVDLSLNEAPGFLPKHIHLTCLTLPCVPFCVQQQERNESLNPIWGGWCEEAIGAAACVTSGPVLEVSPRPTVMPNRHLGFMLDWRTECLNLSDALVDGVRKSNERPVTAMLIVSEAETGGNRLELGLSSSAIILHPRMLSMEVH